MEVPLIKNTDKSYKTVEQQWDLMARELNSRSIFLLAYARGCVNELGMDIHSAYLKAFELLHKERFGFVEPYQFNVQKYKKQVIEEYPTLDVYYNELSNSTTDDKI